MTLLTYCSLTYDAFLIPYSLLKQNLFGCIQKDSLLQLEEDLFFFVCIESPNSLMDPLPSLGGLSLIPFHVYIPPSRRDQRRRPTFQRRPAPLTLSTPFNSPPSTHRSPWWSRPTGRPPPASGWAPLRVTACPPWSRACNHQGALPLAARSPSGSRCWTTPRRSSRYR